MAYIFCFENSKNTTEYLKGRCSNIPKLLIPKQVIFIYILIENVLNKNYNIHETQFI